MPAVGAVGAGLQPALWPFRSARGAVSDFAAALGATPLVTPLGKGGTEAGSSLRLHPDVVAPAPVARYHTDATLGLEVVITF